MILYLFMLSLNDLLSLWGFRDHPFEAYTAEKEMRLADYFVSPPYLNDVIGSARGAAPAVVFGDRGIGKSAIRIYVESLCMTGDPKNELGGRVVAISYDDFSALFREGSKEVAIEDHLIQILQKMTSAALIRIADELAGQSPSIAIIERIFPALDHKTLSRLVAAYFSQLSELQKEVAAKSVYDFLQKKGVPLAERASWFQKLWAKLRGPLVDIANIIQGIRGKTAIALMSGGDFLVSPDGRRKSALDDFYTMAAMAPQLNIDAWYILIDKVDEDEHTDGDADKAARLVLPLLKNLKVIETQHVAFKFLLWSRLRPILIEERTRLDKLRNFELTWTKQELVAMINLRLSVYSDRKVADLTSITDPQAAECIYDRIIDHAGSSPREMVQIIDAIMREHARHSTQENGALITETSMDRGLDDYVMRRVKDLYNANVVRQLASLSSSTFTASDIQSRFRISQQSASSRINKWIDNGLVARVEDARSTKDPSKIMYRYEVVEPRLRRIIDRRLMSPSFDGIEDGEAGPELA